jgi:hypothetical protein
MLGVFFLSEQSRNGGTSKPSLAHPPAPRLHASIPSPRKKLRISAIFHAFPPWHFAS